MSDELIGRAKRFCNDRHYVLLASDYHALVSMRDFAELLVREFIEKVENCGSLEDYHLTLAPTFRDMFNKPLD